MTHFQYPVPPTDSPDADEHRRSIARAVQGLFEGRSNNIGELTLLNGTATTVLSNKRIGPLSFISLAPITANAANLLRTSDVYYSATNEAATFTHANTANADQDYIYLIVGS